MPDYPKKYSKEDRDILHKQSKYGGWSLIIAIIALAISITALAVSIIC